MESLDALRGYCMIFIMGVGELLAALATWFPCRVTEVLAQQMEHMDWHGLAYYDTGFPLFLFIAGISFPFSLASQQAKGQSSWEIHRKIIRRGLVLVVLGVREVNNYTAKETAKVIFLTLFTILIMALIIFIIYVLWAQVLEFVSALFGEAVYRIG